MASNLMDANMFYLLVSYLAGAAVIVSLAFFSWQGRQQDKADLKKLEQQVKDLFEK